MKKNFNRDILIVLIILAISGLVLSVYSWRESRAPFDLAITLWFQSFDSPALRSIMIWVSYIFDSWRMALIVIGSSLIIWHTRGKLEAIFLPVAGIVSTINNAIKEAVGRPRPSPDLVHILVTETSKSYPSGHAFSAILIFGFLLYIILSRAHIRSLRIVSSIFISLLVLLIGASRIFLGVHWTTDVLGGYIIGGLLLTSLIWLYEREKKHLDRIHDR